MPPGTGRELGEGDRRLGVGRVGVEPLGEHRRGVLPHEIAVQPLVVEREQLRAQREQVARRVERDADLGFERLEVEHADTGLHRHEQRLATGHDAPDDAGARDLL